MVPGFSYGRMVYYYQMPGGAGEHTRIQTEDVSTIEYQHWKPVGYAGSAGYKFIQAEDLISPQVNLTLETGNIYADKSIMMWNPMETGEKMSFTIHVEKPALQTRIGLTLAHFPGGGKASILINGKPVKFDDLNQKKFGLKNGMTGSGKNL